ncbi:MAG: 16S rRNA (adenine(1518)-N(6)/adenine(1519)-N(6))-dimethyltransferase RsmA [Alphaproteobacteria bacterium]|nr:16S rRNA (adenine(1518)-N(6)/adenine(1519)-N(6))-dimethyltransferase RsmA [Alphaproteobacteria bacterium]
MTAAENRRRQLDALPPLREIIARHQIGARKSFGQHFLFDLNLTRRIAAAAGDLSDVHVIEVGAGPGGLTRALLETNAASVVAVERDQRCIGALRDLADAVPGRLKVVEADALTTNLADLTPPPRRIIANLPYNIGTQLLLNWLETSSTFIGFTLMFQREVAQRITAEPGSKAYGRLSVLCQWLTEARLLFDVAPTAFVPPPSVTSAVVSMEVRSTPLAPARQEDLEFVTRLAFGQRRKMLRRSLQSVGGAELLAQVDIAETARAEELTVHQFCALANAIDARRTLRTIGRNH